MRAYESAWEHDSPTTEKPSKSLRCIRFAGCQQVVTRDVRTETVRRFALDELMFSERARLLGEDLVVELDEDWGCHRLGDVVCCARVRANSGSRARWRTCVRFSLVTDLVARKSLWRRAAAQLQKGAARTGSYDGQGRELGIGLRTVERWVSRYEGEGEVGLISAKALQPVQGRRTFQLFKQTALDVMREYADMSRPTRQLRDSPYGGPPNRHLRSRRGAITVKDHGV